MTWTNRHALADTCCWYPAVSLSTLIDVIVRMSYRSRVVMIMRCTSPLFPFFTTVFFLGFHQRTAGFLFSQCEGIYPSFRPAKASEVPGAHKSHWLFVTPLPAWNPKIKLPSCSPKEYKYHPAFLHLFFFTFPCIVLVAVLPNHWLDLTKSIRFSLSLSLSLCEFPCACSYMCH